MAGKADIVEHLVHNLEGMTKRAAGDAIEATVECITHCLANGEKVQVPGLGTFAVSPRKERKGRNPQTGATMTIPARNHVAFKAGKQLKDAVNS